MVKTKKEIIEKLKKDIKEGLEPSRRWRAWSFAVKNLNLGEDVIGKLEIGKKYLYEEEEIGDTKIEKWISEDGKVYERIYKWELVEKILDHDEDWGMWKDYTPDIGRTYETYEWVYKGDKEYQIDKKELEKIKKEKKFYYLPEKAEKAPSVLPKIKAFSGIRKMPEFNLDEFTINFTDRVIIKFNYNYDKLSFSYKLEMLDEDEWLGADWEDLPKDYRIEISHAQSLGKEVAGLLNYYKYPNIEELLEKAKQEVEFEKQLDEEILNKARKNLEHKLEEIEKKRNEKIKKIVLGQKIGNDLKFGGRIIALKGEEITKENIDEIFRFIIMTPKKALSDTKIVDKVLKIINDAKKEEEKIIKEEAKRLLIEQTK